MVQKGKTGTVIPSDIPQGKILLESKGASMGVSKASELDLIVCATITADDVSPTAAGAVQEALGAHCPAFDINSACSGLSSACIAA